MKCGRYRFMGLREARTELGVMQKHRDSRARTWQRFMLPLQFLLVLHTVIWDKINGYEVAENVHYTCQLKKTEKNNHKYLVCDVYIVR